LAVGSRQLKTKAFKNGSLPRKKRCFCFYCKLPTANFP